MIEPTEAIDHGPLPLPIEWRLADLRRGRAALDDRKESLQVILARNLCRIAREIAPLRHGDPA